MAPDNRLVMSPGDLFVRDGVTYRYLGNGVAEPVESMEKRFDMADARPMGGMNATLSDQL